MATMMTPIPAADAATATAAAPKAPPAPPSTPSTLIPVRVDVASDDKTVRLVDTLLMDPSCFPVPLYAPLVQAVEDNVRELAYNVISDAEVQGMVRTGRQFSGRVDVWTARLQEKVQDQLRPQLWKIAMGQEVNLPSTSRLTTTTAAAVAAEQEAAEATDGATTTSTNPPGLIPISIRLYTVHRIIVHEDILWDPINSPVTPLEFAQDLAKELNLPDGDEAVIGITTCILEQLYGLVVDGTPDISAKVTQQIFQHNNPSSSSGVTPSGPPSVIEASFSSKEGLRGAYQMSENNNKNAEAQFAHQHRPQ